MEITYVALAASNKDARSVRRLITKKSHPFVKDAHVVGASLIFTVEAKHWFGAPTGLTVLGKLLAKHGLEQYKQLVYTVDVADNFTGVSIQNNVTAYNKYLEASKMTTQELMTAAFA